MLFTIDDKSWKCSRSYKFYDNVYLAYVELQFIECGDGVLYGRVDRFENKNGEKRYVVSLSSFEDMDILLHECIHLVSYIFKDRHIPFDEFNDESIAYYYTWWFKRLWLKCLSEAEKRAKCLTPKTN